VCGDFTSIGHDAARHKPVTKHEGEIEVANYLLAYHGGGMAGTPAEQEKAMAAWGTWFGQLGDAVVDGGNPVGAAKMIAANGGVSDGGGANPLTGYSVIKAASLDAAVAMAKGCPILMSGGSIQVCETFDAM
jgi:hypothetical protein